MVTKLGYGMALMLYMTENIDHFSQVIGDMERDWWFAKSLKSGREGYIPRSNVTALSTSEAEE